MINILLRTKFNDLTAENLAARLKQTKLTIKDGTGDFIKKNIFQQNCPWNKTKHVEAEKQVNDLLREVKLIPTKESTKKLRNGNSILCGAKYFLEYFNHSLNIPKVYM